MEVKSIGRGKREECGSNEIHWLCERRSASGQKTDSIAVLHMQQTYLSNSIYHAARRRERIAYSLPSLLFYRISEVNKLGSLTQRRAAIEGLPYIIIAGPGIVSTGSINTTYLARGTPRGNYRPISVGPPGL